MRTAAVTQSPRIQIKFLCTGRGQSDEWTRCTRTMNQLFHKAAGATVARDETRLDETRAESQRAQEVVPAALPGSLLERGGLQIGYIVGMSRADLGWSRF